jgi:predicted permease
MAIAEAAWRDVRHAVRSLGRAPGFSATVILTLGLGTGANVAIFSIVHHTLFRPLAVPAPEELVNLSSPGPKTGGTSADSGTGGQASVFSYALFRDLERTQTVFTGIAAHRIFDANISVRNAASRETGWLVSGSYFPVLALKAALGRLLTAADDRVISGHPVAVISHDFWERRFNADPAVLNDRLIVNGQAFTIVGVAPPDFVSTTLDDRPRVFVPLTMAALMRPGWTGFENRRDHWLYLFARLKPGLARDAAEREVNGSFAGILREVEFPAQRSGLGDTARAQFLRRRLVLEQGAQGQRGERDQLSRMAVLLMTVTAIVLLMACSNAANLLLARGTYRSAEISLRMSLGASRAQVLRYLLVESCLLTVAASIAGVWLAVWTLSAVSPVLPGQATFQLQFNTPVFAFTTLLAAATALLTGLYPAAAGTRAPLVIRGGTTSGPAAARFRAWATTAQIALSLSLLTVAGLFMKSLVNVSRSELGITASNLVTFRVSPELSGYTPARVHQLVDSLRDELAALPGARAVTMSTIGLFGGYGWSRNLTFEGGATADSVFHAEIAPDYFRTLGIPLVAGREFLPSDGANAPNVAIINESLLRHLNVGTEVLGRRIGLGAGNVPMDIAIVGIVRDAKYSSVKEPPPPQFYLPYRQVDQLGALNFYVRSTAPVEPVLSAIPPLLQRVDRGLPVENLRTMVEQVHAATDEDRALTTLSGAFALLALALAAVGLYGVLSYTAARRRREFGVRVALGADPARIRRLVFAGVGRMALAGGLAGSAAAFALARLAQSFLFGIDGPDAAVMASAAAAVGLVTFASAALPARRAARVDPAETLRGE